MISKEIQNEIDIIEKKDLSIIILELMCEAIPENDPRWDQIAKIRKDKKDFKSRVVVNIDGVEFPLLPALNSIIKLFTVEVETIAGKIALEKLDEAGLGETKKIIGELNSSARIITNNFKNKLKESGLKFENSEEY